MKHLLPIFICFIALSLTGCIGQEIADEKMAKGCVAGVNSLIEPKNISGVENITFKDEKEGGAVHRMITITAIEKDGWLEEEKQYQCLFLEQWGLFKTTHVAMLVRIHIEDKIYGKMDGEIVGNYNDFLALSGTIERAMK